MYLLSISQNKLEQIMGFLMEECCAGNHIPFIAEPTKKTGTKKRAG